MFPKLSKNDQESLRYLYESTSTSVKDIALKFGVSLATVNNYRASLGIHNRRKGWSKQEIDFLKREYLVKGAEYCARILGREISGVYHKAERLRLIHQKKEYDVDKLLSITDPKIAYILGLLWADGHVRKRQIVVSITLIQDDMNVVSPLFFELGDWGSFLVKKRKDTWKQAAGLRCANKQIVDFLVSVDYRDKSFVAPTKILSHIPEPLRHYWWRGYFDGDGCLWVADCQYQRGQLSLASSYDQDWKEHIKLFKNLGLKCHRIEKNITKRGHRHSRLLSYNRDDITKFMNYIYQNFESDNIGLTRKYAKWVLMKSRPIPPKTSKYIGVSKKGDKWRTSYKGKEYSGFLTEELAYQKRKELELLYA